MISTIAGTASDRSVPKNSRHIGARVLGHAVEHEAGGGDQSVAALLLHAGQAGQELVGHVLAQAELAEGVAGHLQDLRLTLGCLAVGLEAGDLEACPGLVVDLAQVVGQARNLEPVRIRGHQAPGGQVVQGGAPEHGLLSTRIHGDVTADGGGVLGSGVHGEGEPVPFGQLRDPAGDHAGAAMHRGDLALDVGQLYAVHVREAVQLLGVDDGAQIVQGYGRAGVAGPAAPGDDGQVTVDAGLHHPQRPLVPCPEK